MFYLTAYSRHFIHCLHYVSSNIRYRITQQEKRPADATSEDAVFNKGFFICTILHTG